MQPRISTKSTAFLSSPQPDAYRQSFLAAKQRPRVFAVSEQGHWSARSGPDALAQAKASCETHGNPCFIYAYNDEIMFKQFVRAAPATPAVARAVNTPAAPADSRLADVHAVPNLSEIGKDGYQKFLATTRRPRAFALSWTGQWSWRTGPEAARKAVESCNQQGGPCYVYALDTDVVWKDTITLGPEICDPVRVDPKLCDVDAVPVRSAGKERYKAFLLMNARPRSFVVSDGGGWRFLSGSNSTERALELCRKGSTGCEVYAEDEKVVWKAR
jgi:hypothetical protein